MGTREPNSAAGAPPPPACVITVERPDLVRHALAKALGRNATDHLLNAEEADAVKVLANRIGDCAAA